MATFKMNHWAAKTAVSVACMLALFIVMSLPNLPPEEDPPEVSHLDYPLRGQAWDLPGRGVVVISDVRPEENLVLWNTQDSGGSWGSENSNYGPLDAFLHQARVARSKTVISTKPSVPPIPHQWWHMKGHGNIVVLNVEGDEVVWYSDRCVHLRTKLRTFLHYATLRDDAEVSYPGPDAPRCGRPSNTDSQGGDGN